LSLLNFAGVYLCKDKKRWPVEELAAAAFNAKVVPSVAYIDPEVAWVGLTEDQAKAVGGCA
jgi:pyruvate/2-oxoglutarate dehydrogenase complex dihydrolipoamide dehydrogenase (E3) component